jgi:hypothetical protein
MDVDTGTDTTSSCIVARLRELADELEGWAEQHRGSTLAEHEQGVLAAVRQALGPLLGAVVARALQLDAPRARHQRSACPDCRRRQPPLDWRTRQPLTVCGAMPLGRPYYYCKPCRRSWVPADTVLDLAAYQQLSAGLHTWLATEGAETPFAAAAGRIERLTGIGVGTETMRTHTETVGAVLVAEQARAADQVEATHEAAEPMAPVAAPDLLLVETDGVMVPYRDDWHEMKVGLVAAGRLSPPAAADAPPPDESTPAAGARGPVLHHPSYVAARLPAAEFGPRLLAEAVRRGALEVVGWEQPPGTDPQLAGVTGPALAVLRPVVVIGDGAKWIWEHVAGIFGSFEIPDWFHCCQHVWVVGDAVYGAGTAQAAAWVAHGKDVIWQEGPDALLRLLESCRATSEEATKTLDAERGYFRTNAERMRYATYRDQGLPVGSGAVESAAKHLVQERMKRRHALERAGRSRHPPPPLRPAEP